ncbi:MAG: hypothetical protein JXK07_09990 [Spirochaetes bacterium]|nr:hypothetical protein [Spirochaetota bacterium]MBN2771272.1 hypothetical protein [Spirochaetota bacterium]
MKQPVDIPLSDGNLGNGKKVDGLQVKLGIAEKGEPNLLYEIASPNDASFYFGAGSLVDTINRHFAEGGKTCYAMRPVNDVEGSVSSVTHTGSGSAVMTVTGDIMETRRVVVEIIQGGAFETATFRYSLDNGITWSDVFTTPAVDVSIALFGSVKVSFSGSGDAFNNGDTYAFSTTAPTASMTEFLVAVDAIRMQYSPERFPYRFIHIIGGFDRPFWEAIKTKLPEFEDARIFINFILEYPAIADGEDILSYYYTMKDELRLFSALRISIVCSRLRYGTDESFKSAAILLGAVLSGCKVNEHPGHVGQFASKTAVKIQHWTELSSIIDSLETAKGVFACQYQNWEGIYIKKDWLLSPADSDFQTIHDLRPADKARFIAYTKIMPYVNSEEGADGDEGGVESLKADIDNAISEQMEEPGNAEIKGHETELAFAANEVTGKLHLQKRGTNERYTLEIGYRKSE